MFRVIYSFMVCLKDYCLISEGRISYNKLYMYKNLKVREKNSVFHKMFLLMLVLMEYTVLVHPPTSLEMG